MKTHFIIFISFLFSLTSFAQTVDLQREADLVPGGYTISGDAFLEELSNGDLQFRLSDDFSTPAGPDVRVILNTSVSSSGGFEVVNLSNISHFSGGLTIDLPSSVDIEDYDFVVFFCVAFNQLWASGEFGATINLGGPTCDDSEVQDVNGNNSIDICPSDNSSDLIQFENTLGFSAGSEYVYLLTDANENLLEVIEEDEYDFEGSSDEEQRVYGMHYSGTINEMIGSNRFETTASGCFEHSSNNIFIAITKNACFVCEDSDVSNVFGSNNVDICPSDNSSDWLEFSNSLGVNDINEYVYLITDENQILEEVVFDNIYNFENSGDDTQRVYGMHYDGTISQAIGSHRSLTNASGCFEHSSNDEFITVTKNACIPPFQCLDSETSTTGNITVVDICPSDGIANSIALENNINVNAGINYAFLITDENQILQEVVLADSYDFEGSGNENQRVYGVHYDGTLLSQVGQNRLMTTASGCYTHSDANTYLSVLKDACPPSFNCLTSVVSSGGSSEIELCANDEMDDILNLSNSINVSAGEHYAYLITDINDELIQIVSADSYNFEMSSTSLLRVHGIHYDGVLLPQIGASRLMTTATECFTHSDDTQFLTVVTDACAEPFECLESSVSLIDQSNQIDICPTDGVEDVVVFTNTLGADSADNYAYLITDSNEILQFVITNNSFNFEGASSSEQRVYGMHYSGDLNINLGLHRLNTSASECSVHTESSDFVLITKNGCIQPFECLDSHISADGNITNLSFCTTDGIEDIVTLNNGINVNDPEHYAYLVTDENEVLQFVNYDRNIDFEGIALDEIRVYGIHFDGTLNPIIGESRMMTTASECFTHSSNSSFLTVLNNSCGQPFECLPTLTATTNWATSISICATDGVDDIVELRNNLFVEPGMHYAYLITDSLEILQEVSFDSLYNFEGTSAMQQRVYGIHFSGSLQPSIGEHRSETSASGCFMHSGDNLFLTVTKDGCVEPFECQESLTATTAWVTNVDICATDGVDDIILLQNNIGTTPGNNYAFLLTDEFEILQEVILDSLYNFENTGIDQARVYGISYSGDLFPAIGEDRKNTTASDCFIHSGDNLFITINKTAACGVSSTDELIADEDIVVFPNPSNGVLNIVYKNDLARFDAITLLDSTGKRLRELNDKRQFEITTAGLYFLHFQSSTQSIVKRIIIN